MRLLDVCRAGLSFVNAIDLAELSLSLVQNLHEAGGECIGKVLSIAGHFGNGGGNKKIGVGVDVHGMLANKPAAVAVLDDVLFGLEIVQ